MILGHLQAKRELWGLVASLRCCWRGFRSGKLVAGRVPLLGRTRAVCYRPSLLYSEGDRQCGSCWGAGVAVWDWLSCPRLAAGFRKCFAQRGVL